MEIGFTTAAYVVAAVLFILSLGGLSGQESAKRAVWYGIVGMALAVIATLAGPGSGLWLLSLVLILGGGAAGYVIAQRVQMTEMPQLVAAMHSLVGLAAVFIGFNTHIEMVRVAAMSEEARLALTGFAAAVAHKGQPPHGQNESSATPTHWDSPLSRPTRHRCNISALIPTRSSSSTPRQATETSPHTPICQTSTTTNTELKGTRSWRRAGLRRSTSPALLTVSERWPGRRGRRCTGWAPREGIGWCGVGSGR